TAVVGLAVPALLSQEPRDCGRVDGAAAALRLSHRLRHRARATALARHPRTAGNPAVLDVVPDPHLCLDQHPAARRIAEPAAAGAWLRAHARHLALDRHRDLYR